MDIVLQYKSYLLPIIFLLLGLLGGTLFKRLVAKYLLKLVEKTSWKGDDIILREMTRYVSVLVLLTGIFLASDTGILFPESLLGPLVKILTVLFVLFGALTLANVTAALFHHYTVKKSGTSQGTELVINLIKGIILAIAILMLLQTFGISITPLLGALGVGSMAAGFALKDTLANLFAGIQILMSKQIRPGDFIQLSSGLEGSITDITLRNTTLIDRSNNTIVVPNAELAIATIVNFSVPNQNLRVKVECGVAYDSDLAKVEKVAIDVGEIIMRTVKGGVPDYDVTIRYHTFNSSSIDFTVLLRATDFAAQHRVRHEYIKLLKKRFDEEGIEIPFPIRTIIRHEDS